MVACRTDVLLLACTASEEEVQMEPDSLPDEIEERLQARARSTGRSLKDVTREAVLNEISAIERYYEEISLRREFRRYRAGAAGPGS
jgi:predicted DNA-binding protein